LRTGAYPVATVMRRLLTGPASGYNRRHKRRGRLFQNRYKSIPRRKYTDDARRVISDPESNCRVPADNAWRMKQLAGTGHVLFGSFLTRLITVHCCN
ncbi:MAG: hypothetical protein P8Y48_17035, partial [Novosphingobium sp.]